MFCIVPQWAPHVPAGWLETPSCVYVTLTPRVLAYAVAVPVVNTWKHKDNGRPSGRLHSDAQVSTRTRKHQKLYTLSLVCVLTAQEDSPFTKFVNLLFIDWKLGFPVYLKAALTLLLPYSLDNLVREVPNWSATSDGMTTWMPPRAPDLWGHPPLGVP